MKHTQFLKKSLVYSSGLLAAFTLLAPASLVFASDVMSSPDSAPASMQASSTSDRPLPPKNKPGTVRAILQTVKAGIRGDVKAEMEDSRGIRASTTEDFHVESRDQDKDEKGEMRANIKEDIKARFETTRFLSMGRVAWIRINAAIERLTKIDAKLDTRIAKIKTAGGNTVAAEGFSADAKTSLTKARADLADIKTIISGVSSSTLVTATSTVAVNIRADGKDAETQLKAAQTAIENAVKSLEALHLSASVTASTTTQ